MAAVRRKVLVTADMNMLLLIAFYHLDACPSSSIERDGWKTKPEKES